MTDPIALIRQLREALTHYTRVVADDSSPDNFIPQIKDEGHWARTAIAQADEFLEGR